MRERVIGGLFVWACVAVGLVLPQPSEAGRPRFAYLVDSAHLEEVPPPGPCDVVITQANQDTTIPMLDDPDKRVFCVEPGNYRRHLHPKIQASGTPGERRYLRYNAPFPAPHAVDQTRRAVFHGLLFLNASYWVVEGITVQPVDTQNLSYLIGIVGGSHLVFEGNYIDASRQLNHLSHTGVQLDAYNSTPNPTPSTHNSIQRNVIRGGNPSQLPWDYTGVSVHSEDMAGAANSYNKILDNEIYDWGDGVQVSAPAGDCASSGSWPKGTLIDGNDIYIRRSKYVDCRTGEPDPRGECACAENGIDVKSPGGSNFDRWTQITNNRLWGFRPTLRDVPSCGGSGARGSAINAGNSCAAHVLVAGNVITDSTAGIVTDGSYWKVIGNLVSETRAADQENGNTGAAIFPFSDGTLVQFNTVVDSDNAYFDTAEGIAAKCNAVIHDEGIKGGGAQRGANHVVKHNSLYDSVSPNLESPTVQTFPEDADSRNAPYCFDRRRFTGTDEVCIPFGLTTWSSPHLDLPATCSDDPGADFGLPGLTFK